MLTPEEFEEFKQDFIEKNQQFIEELKKFTISELQQPGTKGRMAALRFKAVSSYQALAVHMLAVPVHFERFDYLLGLDGDVK